MLCLRDISFLMSGLRNMYDSVIAERFGKRIAEIRAICGMIKVQFAERLGITRR